MKTAFQTASWTRENDFRHRDPQASGQPSAARTSNACQVSPFA